MKPLQVTPEALVVYDDFAELVGPALGTWLEQAKRDRREIHPDHAEAIERLVLMAEGFRSRNSEVPIFDETRAAAVEWKTVKQVATMTGLEKRTVVKRCKAGTLRADQPGGEGTAWRIDAASIPKEDLCKA